MKQSRKMVLISEDEYAQLQAMTKPTEDSQNQVRESIIIQKSVHHQK